MKRPVRFGIQFLSTPAPIPEVWACFIGFLRHTLGDIPQYWDVFAQNTKRPFTKTHSKNIYALLGTLPWHGFMMNSRFPGQPDILLSLGQSGSVVETTSEAPKSLGIYSPEPTALPATWAPMIDAMFGQFQSAFSGYQYDAKYSQWQNCSTPEIYSQNYGTLTPDAEAVFIRILQSSDGIGKPRRFLNLSSAPGRVVQQQNGLFRYVAADLWLGPHFWDYAPCTKEEVLASEIFLEKRDTPHYLYLKSWPHPFTRPDGEQGRVQQKLWRLLFHEDCEWPPGSGGISDEPVGGPPELMP